MKELVTMGKKTGENKHHRKTKAALAAGAVASCVAATAAYRRRNAAGPGDTQPL